MPGIEMPDLEALALEALALETLDLEALDLEALELEMLMPAHRAEHDQPHGTFLRQIFMFVESREIKYTCSFAGSWR